MATADDVVAELAAVRECLGQVAEGIGDLIPKGELDRASVAVVEDNRRWRKSVALLIIGGPLLFIMNLGILWEGHQRELSFRKDIRDGMTCLLGDESSHRRDQRRFETAVIEKLGIKVTLGAESPVPEEDLNVLTGRCKPVLQRFVDLTIGKQGMLPNEAGGG